MKYPKKVIVSVINDLITDQRVHKVCTSLLNQGYKVQLVGRILPNSHKIHREYSCKRFKLWFNTGFLFYANYNIRLFFFLLFRRVDIFYSNDLDTLPANFLVSKIKRRPLVYDSHEFFTQVPELINRPKIQKVWQNIEKLILPKLKYTLTVSSKIQEQYNHMYNLRMKLVRNFPKLDSSDEKEVLNENKVILYQGALNISRGLEEVILAMEYVKGATFWIAGGGDIDKELKELVISKSLQGKVRFLGNMPFEQLKDVTKKASLGVSLEKKEGLNYEYALPNKVFDYIHSGVPVLYSKLPVIEETLRGYEIGEELHAYEPQKLGKQLQTMLSSSNYLKWKKECARARLKFNWENEEQTLFTIFDELEQD